MCFFSQIDKVKSDKPRPFFKKNPKKLLEKPLAVELFSKSELDKIFNTQLEK